MPGFPNDWRGRFAAGSLVALMTVLLAVAPALGQTSPPPQVETEAAPTRQAALTPTSQVEPMTTAPAAGPPPFAPAMAPALAVPPYAVTDAPPVAVATTTDNSPFYQRWWFWTAIGALAVTTVVIVAASSGPNTPKTDFGNMPAF